MLLAVALPAAAAPLPVGLFTPEVARFGDRFSLTGSLTAERAAQLSPRVDGLVASVQVDAGDEVREGDVLLRLDAAMAEHALARARANAAAAQAALDEARRLFEEAERVGEQDFLPATLIATRAVELRGAEAAFAAAEATMREQAELVARHALPAPFDGVIAERHTEAGEWVQRGNPVLTLVATDRVRLDLRVPQERWLDIGDDAEVNVFPDALPGLSLPGSIGAKVPVTDPGARTFLLRLLIEDEQHRLLPGTSARAEIGLPASDGMALGVPRDALLRQPDGGYSLFVVEDDGRGGLVARLRTVRVLLDRGTEVAVDQGLVPGDRVVIRGNEALRDGQAVRAVEDGAR